MSTAYDEVPYPSEVFRQTHPDRLAVIATLHGLDPPPVATARTLDIGGGDGLNVLALGAAFPRARFVNFDLAASAIARGRHWAALAGLDNVEQLVLDLTTAADALDGEFAYIVAHGVYAWVPDAVRAAIFPLIGRLLAPNGVAMVSYNAFPGCYLRQALRDMVLHALTPQMGFAERVATARALLTEFAEAAPDADERPILAGMRGEARVMLDQPDAVMFHDELGDIYAPQRFSDVVADAAASGLCYLNDSGKGMLSRGFTEDPDPAARIHGIQAEDFTRGRYFHHSLFVRDSNPPQLNFSGERMLQLHASAPVVEEAADRFRIGNAVLTVTTPALAGALRAMGAAAPGRVPVAAWFGDAGLLAALRQLVLSGVVNLHHVPEPFAVLPGERPLASALVRMQIGEGHSHVNPLDARTFELSDPMARAFILLLDGTRDRAALERDWIASGHAATLDANEALLRVARGAMLVR